MSLKRKREDNNNNYIYQKADYFPYHCGPFAIYNFLLNYKKHIGLKKLINLCQPEYIYGTSNYKFNKAITFINNKLNIKIKEIEPNISNIKSVLESNGKIIILFHWTHHFHEGEHYALIEKMISPNEFKFINYSFDEPIKIVKLRELKNMLLYHKNKEDICPAIWSLEN